MPGETNEARTSESNASTSIEQSGTTPNEPKSIPMEQVEALIQKATRDAKTEVGRLTKLNGNLIKQSQNVVDRVAKHFGDLEELVKDDPAKLTTIRNRKTTFESDIKADTDRERREQELAEIREYRAEKLAEKYNIDSSILVKYGGETKDSMEELAKSFGERKAAETKTEPQNTQTTPSQRMTEPPVTGKTGGGTGELTVKDVTKMSPQERATRASEIAKISFPQS